MDVHLMIAERRRVANEFRLARTCLAILRAHLSYSLTRETRQHLFPVIGEMSAKSHRLGAKLLEVDAAVLEMRLHEMGRHAIRRGSRRVA